jgi:carboxyl-terminal processing protease
MGLDDGQLKFTISKFYRISGGSTQHKGVVPDIALPSVYDESEIGESSYETALPWDSIHGIRHVVYYPVNDILPALEKRHALRMQDDVDFNYVRDSAQLIADAERNVIELNKDKRKVQLDQWRNATLQLENSRRKAKGLPEYDNSIFDQLDSDEMLPPDPKQTEKEKTEALYSDMYLIESGRVLIDFIDALKASGFYQEGVRKVTHSSATVGWMPKVASNDALVAPQAMAIATP